MGYRAGRTYRSRMKCLREIGFRDYRSYLNSELWAKIRARVLSRDRWTCWSCLGRATQVHHQRYSRACLLGKDDMMLRSLCGPCHEAIEFDEDGSKRNVVRASKALNKIVRKRDNKVRVERFDRLVRHIDREASSHMRSL